MMRLLRVELRRWWARRVTRWACAGVLVLAVLSTLAAYGTARPPSPQEVAAAEEAYAAELAAWEADGAETVADCEASAEAAGASAQEWGCADMEPRLEWYLPPAETFVPGAQQQEELSGGEDVAVADGASAAVVEEIRGSVWNGWSGLSTLDDLAMLLLMGALVLGVSFVTAEIHSGSLGMWLTFEPRRQRVYWSKAAAAAVGSVPLVLVGFGLLVAGSYAVFAHFGTLGDVTGAVWTEAAAFTGRLVLAGAVLATVGVALGALLKHAAAVVGLVGVLAWVGIAFGYAWGELQRWLPTTALTAWLQGGTVLTVENCAPAADGVVECVPVDHVVTATQGGATLLGFAVVLTAVAMLVFRRRDVS